MKTIATARLRLRPLHPADGPSLLALFNNWNVIRWLAPVPWPYTPQMHAEFLAHAASRADSLSPIHAILLDGKPIGQIECGGQPCISAPADREDVGFWLGEPYWGRGYLTEALAALVAHVFAERRDVAVIRSGWFEGNAGSARVHEKAGFEVVELVMKPCLAQGRDLPLWTARLTRARYEGLQR